MATSPDTTNPTIDPAFKRVQQSGDFDDAFACIATIAGKSLDDVRQVAISQFGHPKHGPYWVTEDAICKLFAHFGFVSTVYKEITSALHPVDVCIMLVDYDPATEIGRHVVFVRDKRHKPALEYVIDPAYWVDPSQHVRTDFKALKPAWYMGVHPMNSTAARK